MVKKKGKYHEYKRGSRRGSVGIIFKGIFKN